MTSAAELVLGLVAGCEQAARQRLAAEFLVQYPRPVGLLIHKYPTLVSVARQVGLDYEEINAAGLYGVVIAAARFDPARGSFTNYAPWWIRAAVGDLVRHWSQAGRRRECQLTGKWDWSGDREMTVADLPVPTPDPPDYPLTAAEALALMGDRERLVVETYYGLGDGRPQTYSQVAAAFRLSKARVQQIVELAAERVRKHVRRRASGCGDQPTNNRR